MSNTDIRFEDGTLYVTRIYNAPREAVFDAWINTSKIEQWWGCAQTTAVQSDIEPKLGGKFNHIMTLKGVGDYPMSSCFTEYDPPAKLAYTAEATDNAPAMKVTVEFLEHPDGTEVRLVHEGLPEDFIQYVRPGWTAAFDKLEKFLQTASV